MSDTDPVGGDVPPASPSRICSECGKKLSRYNKTGRCFHHPDLVQVKREKAKAEKLARDVSIQQREQARKTMAAITISIPSFDTLAAEVVTKAVCKHWNVVIEQLLVQDRRPHIVVMRHILMYLLYEDTDLSYPDIGELLGGRDHTTIMHGVEKIAEAVLNDAEVITSVNKIRDLYPPVTNTPADPA